ncbi:PoNe immunity protein domain-containing protein [Inhella proteolytica]|uniref:DUF1911 domain-containing protein n=1 Tax=Inhella proteolytica TaxID=2795029 RepID=A0A931NJC5_9BURK|nr:PoNe immunity protein domain-containing protein [Inhella proteolytica]MBH9578884.1 DUF1911 domain-containing protein [Inhella proteolytica]
MTSKYFTLNRADINVCIDTLLLSKTSDREALRIDPSTEGGVFKERLKLLRLHYTAGEPIDSLRLLFLESMQWFRDWHSADLECTKHLAAKRGEDLRLDMTPVPFEDLFHFQIVMDFISVGILLGEFEAVREAAKLMQSARHSDMLYEALIEKIVPDPDTEVTEFFHEQPYDPLLDAIFSAESPQEASAFVKKYLEGWYKAFEGVPWHNGHLVVTDEYSNYEGYWAFEAAAICVLYGIDDSGFRDHIVYPKDLADWAREHKVLDRLVPSGSSPALSGAGLRCESGQACPQSGYWLSPAQVGSRRHFQAGDLMPILGGDYGVTIWQWDENQQP